MVIIIIFSNSSCLSDTLHKFVTPTPFQNTFINHSKFPLSQDKAIFIWESCFLQVP